MGKQQDSKPMNAVPIDVITSFKNQKYNIFEKVEIPKNENMKNPKTFITIHPSVIIAEDGSSNDATVCGMTGKGLELSERANIEKLESSDAMRSLICDG